MYFDKKTEKQIFDTIVLTVQMTETELESLKDVLGISVNQAVVALNISIYPGSSGGQFRIQLRP